MTRRPPRVRAATVASLSSSMVRIERRALVAVELAARGYATHTHGNLAGDAYRAREEDRDRLLDALSRLDSVRGA